MPIKEESEFIVYRLKMRLKQATTNYVSTKERNSTNLSKKYINGFNSLKKKVKDQEIIISKLINQGVFLLDVPSTYKEASLPYVKDDNTITYEQQGELETIINIHAIFWISMLEVGKETGSILRIKSIMININSPFALMYTLKKGHESMIIQ